VALDHIPFLGQDVPLPLRFASRLPFSDEDRRDFPWLGSDIRYYGISRELGKGGRAVAYLGYVCDPKGHRLDNTPDIVLKFPNIDTGAYDSDQIYSYLGRLRDEGGREWQLTRRRLRGCEFANPLLDFSNVQDMDYLGQLMPLPVTAQQFLKDPLALDGYLVDIKERKLPYKGKKGIPVDNWNGISDPRNWIRLARGIATGLADIHLRRVVHGDIWPPNIFIKKPVGDSDPQPVFIDFGESFPIEPGGDARNQRDHAYRAPERRTAESMVSEQADVYSFGKLLLHLATGEEPILSNQYTGHERRAVVREKFSQRNNALLVDSPFIIDLICKCIALDPVDRPKMVDVVRSLNSYVDRDRTSAAASRTTIQQLDDLRGTWNAVVDELHQAGSKVSPYLEEMIIQKIDELGWMIRGLTKEVVDLSDTRENIILALINLFEKLQTDDRFLSITSPHLWQGGALGLDGRYFTATALAGGRNASIERGMVFSVQEVGYDWALALSKNLKSIGNRLDSENTAAALSLRDAISREAALFKSERDRGEASEFSEPVMNAARKRLTLVVQSYVEAGKGICKGMFHKGPYKPGSGRLGLYVGLIPTATVGSLRAIKASHPVSIFYFSHAPTPDQYMLMMTDCAGRNSLDGYNELSPLGADISFQLHRPELRGVRVFKSVLGKPEDRIKRLEQRLLQSHSIGDWASSLHEAMPSDT
jgi:Protein kinase domain